MVWSDLDPEKDKKRLKVFVQEVSRWAGEESSLAYSLKEGLMPKHPQNLIYVLQFHDFYAVSCQDN